MDVQFFHSPYSEELTPATPAMLMLPGTRANKPPEIDNGIPDRLDELQALVMPQPVRPTHTTERPTQALFDPSPSMLFPEVAVGPGTTVLPQWNGLFKLEKPDAALLPIALSSENAASFPGALPELSSVRSQPFTCIPVAAGRLIRLPLPPAAPAYASEELKKSGGPTDGFCTAPGIELAYPRLRSRIQPGWGARRSRLVRVYAGVPARNLSGEVCGSPEPADASIWQAPLIPRTGLVPAVWLPDQHEPIQDSGVVNARRELAGIGRVVRFWESPRGIKGGLVVLSCLLALGIHSTLSNPQPASAITETAAEATVTGPLRTLQESLVKRASVYLSDDFRTGLHAWEGGEDWSDSWSYDDAGFVHPGRLALYSPSLKMSDYRMEFVGQINKKGLGWAIRAADVENYVAVKLVQVRTGPLPRLAVIRYAVINGKEERHRQIAFPFEARADTVYNVRMEVKGNRYSLYIQDRIADTWEDDRFRNGGIGFFNAKGEDARLRWVRITYQYDWVGRICAALAG